MDLIYLDHNATTALDSEAFEAMRPWFTERFGNASAAYALGHLSDGAVVAAREQAAALVGCTPAEVVFTSGGTESLNHAVKGVWEALPAKRHLVTTAVEHPALRALVVWWKGQGGEITDVGVDGEGRLDLAALEAAVRPDTALVAIMAANNETGVLFPVAEAARIAKARGALFLVDATQAAGKIPVDAVAWGADLLCLSGHKFHGPKGTGLLMIRRGVRLKPLMLGGSQERGRRGGTENVPGIVGLGKAAERARLGLPRMERVRQLRDGLEARLGEDIPELRIHGGGASRLPNTSLVGFAGLEGEALQLRLGEHGICVSTGSACSTGMREPSHVLRAMQVPEAYAIGTVRFSLGRDTTEGELAMVLDLLPGLVLALRENWSFKGHRR
ncbi:MAG: aminotransferase class V-fold PLP-dependent enzyme [Geothrix sp.]|uniref:cysteine desulfurase family protein n=1 Tax=Geothrix sp. TaxID=1962974 RepID=UPI0017A890A9|nr:aminotransferase class V-fold PLP-dependent enzyme [Geothrix sp.]NWJ39671.1 aminotransferase class V-fold PLP-dependent enzyme [Geothrix sp.]WIL22309.1 MAG: aminotransferase class V-fold PLP-dependent enzyme [Geothrix sp.]